ncbi:hypothetical protein JKP88DRAFT_240561 [Tribonema minus]|uniref:Uncharacterized protein n=1 Tax=Tribonema minus TaxID=303371 RepID=A0A835ZHD7_9STRA|nr:hypothetical protein JKP88DRAFT_240561 [Tribonema minus]
MAGLLLKYSMLLRITFGAEIWAKRVLFNCPEDAILNKVKDAIIETIPALREREASVLQITYNINPATNVIVSDGATLTEIFRREMLKVDANKLAADQAGKGLHTWTYAYELPLNACLVRMSASSNAGSQPSILPTAGPTEAGAAATSETGRQPAETSNTRSHDNGAGGFVLVYGAMDGIADAKADAADV